MKQSLLLSPTKGAQQKGPDTFFIRLNVSGFIPFLLEYPYSYLPGEDSKRVCTPATLLAFRGSKKPLPATAECPRSP